MPTVAVFDMTGKKTGEMELNAAVFGIEPNMTVVHAAVKNYLANQRQGTQSTLTRAEVRGGGIKPWRLPIHDNRRDCSGRRYSDGFPHSDSGRGTH